MICRTTLRLQALAILLMTLCGTAVFGQPQSVDHTQTETVRGFIQESGTIGYVILGLLALAILLVLDQLRLHFLELVRGRALYRMDTRQIDRREVTTLIKLSGRSRIARLLAELTDIYDKTRDFAAMSAGAGLFKTKEETRFNNFDSRMVFLADTAGGLGLLGTVLGIYQAFKVKGGGMDDKALLAAMGLALGTTFLGILVSVIINWMTTEMGASVNKRVLGAMDKADALKDIVVEPVRREPVLGPLQKDLSLRPTPEMAAMVEGGGEL